MTTADNLIQKLDEIRAAIRNRSFSDGTCFFDPAPVMVSLNLALNCVTETGRELPKPGD